MNVFIVALALVLLPVLLYHEKKEKRKGLLLSKTLLSCLFIFAALTQPRLVPIYSYLILTGLILCLGGDVFLALPQKNMFLYGLVSFLMGHLLYIFALYSKGE